MIKRGLDNRDINNFRRNIYCTACVQSIVRLIFFGHVWAHTSTIAHDSYEGLLNLVSIYRKFHTSIVYNFLVHHPTYSPSYNLSPPISRVLIGQYLIFCSLKSPTCYNSPRKCTPVKYKKRQKAWFPIVT